MTTNMCMHEGHYTCRGSLLCAGGIKQSGCPRMCLWFGETVRPFYTFISPE